ncbi:MAG: transcription elongation factor GreA [Myxococcales bacterium FL481]|nr:MAG: transcription elongation factor GreA [Myxococcales bacterium FL481]
MDERFPMTPGCQEKLRAELKHIKEVDRPDNVREIEAALEHGDLRENAEYHAAKERQGALDARLRYLEYRLSRANVIDPETVDTERIAFGATVTVVDLESDKRTTYAIVGEDESDAERGHISITSPIARALIGKSAGDDATVKLPRGERDYEIVDVCYKAIAN